jgi:hypothetical protein
MHSVLAALKLPTYAELYERIACRGVVGRHSGNQGLKTRMLLEECEVLRPTIEPENMSSTLDN